MKQLWQDPAFREKNIEASREKWKDPEYRAKMKAREFSKETRARIAQGVKESWQNPLTREHRLAKMRESAMSPERRELSRSAQLARWARPGEKEAQSLRAKAMWEDPETRRRITSKHPRGNTRARAKAKGVCVYCGEQGTEWDHDVPLTRGGSKDSSNLVPCCSRCNNSKGRLTGAEFRETTNFPGTKMP